VSRSSGPAFEPSTPKVDDTQRRIESLRAAIRESGKRTEEKKP
jgi:hypothetical protein